MAKSVKMGNNNITYTPKEMIVCEAGTEDMSRIPMSESLRKKINARTKTTQFEITYSGFTSEAKTAFEYATNIWSSLFSSSVPIRVSASYTPLDNSQTLGQTSPGSFIANFRNAPKINTWYQMPIAEKIAGEELNGPNAFDIIIEFNSTADWYFDIVNPDSIVGTGLTDFATVALHELGHALGFSAFAQVDDTGNGDITLGDPLDLPMAYSRFLELVSGESLVDDIQNNGKEMGDALTSEALSYRGPTTSVRVYAPADFNPGSSISHTDQLFNELMNPFLGPNGYIHDPGRAEKMMDDYGWEFLYMLHEPLPSTENFDQTFEITTEVFADHGYDTASLQLHYSTDAFLTDTSKLNLIPTGQPNMYSAMIPNPGKGEIFSYYLTGIDSAGRVFTNPGEAPEKRIFQFAATPDDSIPTITHSPIDFVLDNKTELEISASIVDFFTGIDTVYVEYLINDVEQTAFNLTLDTATQGIYNGTMVLSGSLTVGQLIKYRIIAKDKAIVQNVAMDPATGFHEILVEGIPDPVLEYANDFNTPTTDFLGDKFKVETPASFTDGALHSIHPYEQAGEDNEINYISQLKIPIIIDASNSIMTFDEVVLVEPGDPVTGATFGDPDFWDYVIVEGSSDDGGTWIPLLPGYDSRDKSTWLQRYNNGLSGQNSTSMGDPSFFETRTIDLLANGVFADGDTILIRFRLFSDPFAVGWGWAIDNLKIQGESTVVAISHRINDEKDLTVYPNPSQSGLFNMDASLKVPVKVIQIRVLDSMGRLIRSDEISSASGAFNYLLDLQDQPPGIYVLNTSLGFKHISKKIIKSQ